MMALITFVFLLGGLIITATESSSFIWVYSFFMALYIVNGIYVWCYNNDYPNSKQKDFWWFMGSIKYLLPIKTKTARKNIEATITFQDFLKMYTINPNKWYVDNRDYVVYRYEDPDHYYCIECTELYFKTYRDVCKFQKWKNQQEINAEAEKLNKERAANQDKYMAALKDMQRDIQKREEDIEKQRKENLDKIEKEKQDKIEQMTAIVYKQLNGDMLYAYQGKLYNILQTSDGGFFYVTDNGEVKELRINDGCYQIVTEEAK